MTTSPKTNVSQSDHAASATSESPREANLQSLRDLLEKATKGPWIAQEAANGARIVRAPGKSVCMTPAAYLPGPKALNATNAAFIAAARSALPALLDEVEGLRDDKETLAFERDEFASKATTWEICSDSWKDRAQTAEGERDRLVALLEPFAEAAARYDDPQFGLEDDDCAQRHGVSGRLRVGHFRAARASLSKGGGNG